MSKLYLCVLSVALILSFTACKDKATNPNLELPVIETIAISQISSGRPNTGVRVLSEGASPLLALAICWGESPQPDMNGDHQSFSIYEFENPYDRQFAIYNLTPGVKHYVRAYAKNSHGEVWGEEFSFTMLPMLWDVIDLGNNIGINKVFFHDQNIGWICGSGGMIKKSTNGGSTWETRYSGTNAYLMDMQWLDHNNAWIAGSQDIVLKTVNGGLTWQQVAAGTTESEQFTGVHFNDLLTGYAVSVYGGVFKTTDGGDSWQQVRNETTYVYHKIWSLGEKVIIVGEGLRISSNGGSTWRGALTAAHEYQNIIYSEPSTLWVMGNISEGGGGVLYKSTDLGETWTLISTQPEHAINSLSIAPGSQKMWMVGDYGGIFNSTDGGLSWGMNYNLLRSTMFKSVCAVDDSTVWISGYPGKLLKLKRSASD